MTIDRLRHDGAEHLRRNCPVLGPVVEQVGPCRLRLRRDRFAALARAILYQQISGLAAKSIHDRLLAKLPDGRLAPRGLADLDDADYRAAGVSGQKAKYLRSLAELTLAGKVRLTGLDGWSDERIVEELVQVKGVGVWTAQMFLIFTLGRPDVLPADDLGVRSAIRKLYGLSELPQRDDCERLARPWRPFASVASWYCWRSLEIRDPGV